MAEHIDYRDERVFKDYAPREQGDGKKLDVGKLRHDLISPVGEEKLAEVYTIGADKYQDNGWLLNPIEQKRVVAALKRHVNKWEQGEDRDQVDGQLHMAAVAWCAFAIMHYREYDMVDDDRAFARPVGANT